MKVTDPLSLNRYTYGHNNPIIYQDPDGEAVFLAALAIYATAVMSAPDFQLDLFDMSISMDKKDYTGVLISLACMALPFVSATVVKSSAKWIKVAASNADTVVRYADDLGDAGKVIKNASNIGDVAKSGLEGAQAMLKTQSANAWGTLADGTNQGIKHFNNYWEAFPDRIPSIAKRLGVDPADLSNTVSGFENFTKAAQNVIDNSTQSRVINGKSLYFVKGAENVNKGVAVIVKDGKIQSMMPTTLKDFLKLE